MPDELILLSLVIAFPFIGSFLGVVIMRSGRETILGRSRCDTCGHTLGWHDLIPLLSWVANWGRCRYCHARTGFFYPAVELSAAVPVIWAATIQQGWLLIVSAVFGWVLIALAWIDARTQRLPDALTLPLAVGGLAASAIYEPAAVLDHVIGAGAGFAAFWGLGLVYRRLRGREGLGLGDAKLVAGLGAWVSWEGLPTVIFIAALAGIVLAAARALLFGKETLQGRLAFGPPLALAGWIVWLYGPLVPS